MSLLDLSNIPHHYDEAMKLGKSLSRERQGDKDEASKELKVFQEIKHGSASEDHPDYHDPPSCQPPRNTSSELIV
jgi:hypothetical protein